jgi:hypothetical protein
MPDKGQAGRGVAGKEPGAAVRAAIELLHPALIAIAARRFIDHVGDNPLDGWEIGSRHLSLSWLPWCQHPPQLSGCRARGLAASGKRTHLPVTMLDLTEEETDGRSRDC